MNRSIAIVFLPLTVGILLATFVVMVGGVAADNTPLGADATSAIQVNGLYWADGDYTDYQFISQSEPGGRGYLYTKWVDADTIYSLVRVSYSVNDNTFSKDRDYTRSVDWNPGHDFRSLAGSDHLAIYLQCGNDRWEWSQDLLYDADNSAAFDWRSDQYGPDGLTVASSTGSPIPPSGIVITSHSSLEYNLEHSSWILITQTNATTNPENWMSLDLEPLGTISTTNPMTDVNAITGIHEEYPFFRSTGLDPGDLWEWEISYEMELDVGHCNVGDVEIGADSAHNSPAKDDEEDIIIPTAVTMIAIGVDVDRPMTTPIIVAAGALLLLTALAGALSLQAAATARESRR